MKFQTEKELINTVAENYLEKPEQDLTEEYKALGQYNEDRFKDIPVPVHFTDEDPYKNAEQLFNDIQENNQLYVFSGGSAPDGLTRDQNLKGRAVHDYFGHFRNRCDFSTIGEIEKYMNQKSEVPDQSEELLFSEVVGQVCLVHYLEDGFSDPDFRQREVLLDSDIREAVECYYREVKGITS